MVCCISLFLILGISSSVYPMESLTKKDKPAMSPKALLAVAEQYLLEDEEYKPDYARACQYFEEAAEQKEDLEVRARADLHLGTLYYFRVGGLGDNRKMDHYLSTAGLAACQLKDLQEIVRMTQILRQPQPYNIHQTNRKDESPLHYAAKKGYLHMVELLLMRLMLMA